jgi:type II secretory pathway component PulF
LSGDPKGASVADTLFPTFRALGAAWLRLWTPAGGFRRLRMALPLPYRWAGRAESAAVVRLLAACREADVAPAAILDAWSQDSRVGQARRLAKAARLVRQGTSPAAVVECVPGLVQDDHATAIRFGERTGLVGPAVRAALAADTPADAVFRRRVRGGLVFAAVMALACLLVTMFLAIKILPQFKKIVEDHGTALPAATQRWRDWVEMAAEFGVRMVLPAVVLGIALWVSPALRQFIARPFTRRWRAAAALDALGVGLAAGRPLSDVAAVLAACQTDGRIAARLWRSATDGPVGKALADAGLLKTAEGRLVDAARGAEPAVLARLADRRRAAARGRAAAWWQAASLAALVALAAVVFGSALAIFMPLIELIHGLSGVRP